MYTSSDDINISITAQSCSLASASSKAEGAALRRVLFDIDVFEAPEFQLIHDVAVRPPT